MHVQSRRLGFLHFGRRRSRSASKSRKPQEEGDIDPSRTSDQHSTASSGSPQAQGINTQTLSPVTSQLDSSASVPESRGRPFVAAEDPEARRVLGPRSSSRHGLATPGLLGELELTIIHHPSSRNLDIIFVHGLGGGSRKTWCFNRNPSIFWPEWLPQISTLTRARISTFGYNADIIANTGTTEANVESFAKQLLHCLTVHGQRHEKFGRVCT